MNYNDTIEYLYSQLPMFSRIGISAYKTDLHNTIALCKNLGDPQHKFKSIHIAGTNGKGSTSHMLAAILQEAGYKTGLYTSPHIKDFRERVRINGKMIEKDFVVEFVKNTRVMSDEINPSFFELTVAMAFEYFAQEKVDIAVIETGLGGRLDSTNIIDPVLAVITNIGFDHMNILGNTLPEIAAEKAGIIKANKPVVIGETIPETHNIFLRKATEMNAPIQLATENYLIEYANSVDQFLLCAVRNINTNTTSHFKLDLAGYYQSKNLCTVLTAVDQLQQHGFIIPEPAVKHALEHVKEITGLLGRWDIIGKDPVIILDVAHNEDGIKQVLQQLKKDYSTAAFHFILGFVNDKDIKNLLRLFPKNADYYFTNAHIPRALPYETLQQQATENELTGEGYDDVNDAIRAAKERAAEKDVIMVCGSFFIIAEVK
ncbi:folylpolyglutamate synthase/dihydrofolate synthase family protein [soil metagenome]